MPGAVAFVVRALAVWALMMLAESASGALRRLLFHAEALARPVGVVVGCLIIFAICWLGWPWMRVRTASGALAVGVGWAGLTLAFEVVLGRALGLGWGAIAADYDLAHGGWMPLGLVVMALTPLAVQRLRGLRSAT